MTLDGCENPFSEWTLFEEIICLNRGFEVEGKGYIVCKLKNSLYGLKKASNGS